MKRVTLLLGCLLVACGSDDTGSPDAAARDAAALDAGAERMTCATIAERCAGIQKVCEEQASGPVCVGCPDGQFARDGVECADLAGEVTEHRFDELDIAGGFEQDGLCQSWTLGNDETIWVNGIELFNEGAFHHSNWFFVPEDEFAGEDGAWDCKSREFTEPLAAVLGGVVYAQSTQAQHEVQTFPPGVAIRIPPRSKIIGATHVLNFRTEALKTQFRMRLYALAQEDVEVPLAFMRLNYSDLTIPPGVESEFFGECDMEMAQRRPLDADLYWVLPHYHKLGAGFRLERFGGEDDGEVLFEVDEFNAEAQGRMFDPPISLEGAKGLRFACRYANTTDREVGYGIGDQEMCVMLAFLRSDFFYDALVDEGHRVEGSDAEPRYTGRCGLFAGPAEERNALQ